MPTRSISELEGLLDQLERETEPLGSEALESVASAIAKMAGVQPDEVAVLRLRGKTLTFAIPEKLRAIGSIPLSSSKSLAARTARERRADIVNNFAEAPHASVFEGVPLLQRQGVWIHKLISAPIVRNKEVLGVVQISRKGESPRDCGPDFKPADLKTLLELNDLLARFLTLPTLG
jgi:GAF domain